jgi:two-component system, chemotaxis family, sensor kinase Cph1
LAIFYAGLLEEGLTIKGLLECLVSQLSDLVMVVCSPDGKFLSWNPAVLAHFGYTEAEFVGQDLQLLYPPAEWDSGGLSDDLDAAKIDGRVSGRRCLLKKNGEAVMVECVTIALRDEAGTLQGFGRILKTEDLQARLRMQEELELANDRLKRMANELERSNEELEEFARIASHDLSAPITSTRWLVDLLTTRHGRQLDEEGRKFLKQISISLERMADLVEAVLTHAQVGMSAIGSSEDTDAEEALAVSLENLRRDIATSEAVILHEPLPPLPIQAQPLNQLFQNLLSNAIKYRRPGVVPQVSVRAERNGIDWVVAVQDNGIGIEPEWTERIFLPLQRRHGMQVAGSGIGLATCKKIVTRAGGRIWVESEIGSGSTFYFSLPAAGCSAN